MITPDSSISPTAQMYADLRDVLRNIRWLQRGCLMVFGITFFGGLFLWILRNPQTFGF
jgi:hypothetical protein